MRRQHRTKFVGRFRALKITIARRSEISWLVLDTRTEKIARLEGELLCALTEERARELVSDLNHALSAEKSRSAA